MRSSTTEKGHLIFRADASPNIGIGHLMRCFGLAQCARLKGFQTSFLSNIQPDSFFIELAEKENITLIRIPSSHPHPDDLRCTENFLGKIKNRKPWVVLDGYHLDEAYQRRIKDLGVGLMVIDDTAHFSEYQADVLVNPNLYANRMNYKTLPHTLKLFGTNFLLLRNDLLKLKTIERTIPEIAGKILVAMGGSDPVNFTGKVVKALNRIDGYTGEVKIVLGPLNQNMEEIENSVASTQLNIQLIKDPAKFAELIAWADIGITAAGTSTWEMNMLGLPLITVSVAENQNRVGDILKQHSAALHLGWHENITIEKIADTVHNFIYDYERRHRFSINQRQMVDGHGAGRVVNMLDILTTKQVPASLCTIRSVGESDCRPLWYLANDPVIRKNSFQKHRISLDEHCVWFQKKMRSDQTWFQILDVESVIAGQIRYELAEGYAELSFSIAAPFRGMGLGKTLIKKTWKEACQMLRAKGVRARVKKDNIPSVKSFQKADFDKIRNDRINGADCLIFEKRYDKSQDKNE